MSAVLTAPPKPLTSNKKVAIPQISDGPSPTAAITSSLLKQSKQQQKKRNGHTSEENLARTLKHPSVKPFVTEEPARGTMVYYTLTLGTLLLAYATGIIRRYNNNRGSGGILKTPDRLISSTINSVRDHFNPLIFGTPFMAMVKEGGEPFYVLADGHQRFDGLLSRAMEGKMSQKEIQQSITIGVCHAKDHLSVYIGLGQSRPHTPSQRLLNQDLLVGFHLTNILSECKEPIGGLNLKQYSNVMYALWAIRHAKQGKLPEYIEVFSPAKSWVREMSLRGRDDPNGFKASSDQYSKIAQALDFYISWREYILQSVLKDADSRKIIHKTIISAPFCGLILLDFLAKTRRLIGQRGPIVFAQRCLRNKNWLAGFVPAITHGTAENMDVTINRIFTKIGK